MCCELSRDRYNRCSRKFIDDASSFSGDQTVMTDSLFVAVGALVWLFGIAMVLWHVRQRRINLSDASLSPHEIRFQEQRYRRRMQTSALTITLGALIALCDYLAWMKASPAFFAGYVIVLLFLTIWLILLAMGDAMASRVHLGQSLRRNRNSRLALQQAIDELRNQRDRDFRVNSEDLFLTESRTR
jgi:hypothetical protein